MTLSDFITRVNYRLRGLDDEAPTAGTDEHTYWVDTLNMKKDELYQDVSKQWNNTYEILELGTVTAGAAISFDLDESFLSAANQAYVIDTEGRRHNFTVIKAQEDVDDLGQHVFISGQDPEVLYFAQEVAATDNIVGGTLYLPAYVMPDDVVATDENAFIPLPDPNWGVYAVAAEVAANDLTYEDKEANLSAKANALYSQMAKKSGRGTAGNPRRSKYTMKNRIGQRHN